MFATATQLVDHYQPQLATMWEHKLSQINNRLKDCVTYKPLSGKVTFIDQIEDTEFEEKTGRMQKTELGEMEFDKRAIRAREFSKAIGFDEFDEIKLSGQQLPIAETMQKLSQAYQRKCEKVIIDGIFNTNYGGVDGVTPIDLPASQFIDLDYHYDTGTGNVGLTFDKFTRARRMFMEDEVYGQGVEDGADKICMAVTASGIEDLYHSIYVHNKEYLTAIERVRNGEVNEFMGIYLKRTEQVPTRTVGGDIVRDLPVWLKSRVKFGDRNTYSAKMSIRDDLDETIQIRAKGACGAARTEEKAVIIIPCKVTN